MEIMAPRAESSRQYPEARPNYSVESHRRIRMRLLRRPRATSDAVGLGRWPVDGYIDEVTLAGRWGGLSMPTCLTVAAAKMPRPVMALPVLVIFTHDARRIRAENQ